MVDLFLGVGVVTVLSFVVCSQVGPYSCVSLRTMKFLPLKRGLTTEVGPPSLIPVRILLSVCTTISLFIVLGIFVVNQAMLSQFQDLCARSIFLLRVSRITITITLKMDLSLSQRGEDLSRKRVQKRARSNFFSRDRTSRFKVQNDGASTHS